VETERRNRKGNLPLKRENCSPKGQSLHPCMRAPEWNFLSWLVERERETEGERLSFEKE
jgi:hypothetical protein